MDQERLEQFAEWVWASGRLVSPQTEVLSCLMEAFVRRQEVMRFRERREWGLASAKEAQVMAWPLSSLLFTGLSATFGEEPFDLDEYKRVKSYFHRQLYSA